MTTFHDLKIAVSKQFTQMSEYTLFSSAAGKDELWDTYLGSFPEGANPIYRENTVHDCNCCKQFIRAAGNVLAIVNGELQSVWDVKVGGDYQPVADALAALTKARGIDSVYLHSEKSVGTDQNHEQTEEGVVTWHHFHQVLPKKVIITDGSIGKQKGSSKSNFSVLKRSIVEITDDAIDVVLELIDQKSLYRGEEHVPTIKALKAAKIAYAKSGQNDLSLWLSSVKLGRAGGFRNTVIGTLLVDLSEGVELDKAVKSFETKVAPANYKRSKTLVTPRMIKLAQEKCIELGITEALPRRYAVMEDITINNVLFADRSAKKVMGVFDVMTKKVSKAPKLGKVEEVSIDTFLNEILPTVESMEVLVENKHTNNFTSLIAPIDKDAGSILKWNNNFTWSYNGEVADSMREQVVAKGGRVDGALRFTHAWNHEGQNQSLMDLHVFFPRNTSHPKNGEVSEQYGNSERVGWNNRKHHSSGGVQDVDHTSAPDKMIPIENITFPSVDKMPEGTYTLMVHNWKARQPNNHGFKAEIEFGGEVFQYTYDKAVANHEWVEVAKVSLKQGKFSIEHTLPESASTKDVWGVPTQQFHKVTTVMNSPNHWDGEETGNKHTFFMLEDCLNPDKTRTFYNEQLRSDLTPHRKVFEVLAGQLKAEKSDKQLSGVGFSSTKRAELVVKVSGSFNRTLKVLF